MEDSILPGYGSVHSHSDALSDSEIRILTSTQGQKKVPFFVSEFLLLVLLVIRISIIKTG